MAQELGYTFSPGRRASELGFSSLKIVICIKPSHLHFDPKSVSLNVYSQASGTNSLTIQHGGGPESQYQVVAGPIHIEDKIGKVVAAVCFGGVLMIDASDPECTICTLSSPAPILGNFSEHSVARILAEETQILLAERQSAWEGKEDEYERRLGAIEPLALYYACLASLQEHLKKIHMLNEEESNRALAVIKAELQHRATTAGQTEDGRAERLEDIL
jgi:hypothetical protein